MVQVIEDSQSVFKITGKINYRPVCEDNVWN